MLFRNAGIPATHRSISQDVRSLGISGKTREGWFEKRARLDHYRMLLWCVCQGRAFQECSPLWLRCWIAEQRYILLVVIFGLLPTVVGYACELASIH